MLATFSMASMTDVVFLLLVFFMVTSAFVFPTAIEIDLPESTQQTPVKPSTRVFVDAEGAYFVLAPEADEPSPVASDSLALVLGSIAPVDSLGAVAVYADAEVPYGKVVEVLNIGAENSIKWCSPQNRRRHSRQPPHPRCQSKTCSSNPLTIYSNEKFAHCRCNRHSNSGRAHIAHSAHGATHTLGLTVASSP